MTEVKKATLEVVYFDCKDIITTSSEHDNGYIDGGDLQYLIQDLKKLIK